MKKETVSAKYERLRLRHWVMFWVLVAATHALVIAIFSNVDVRTLLPVNVVNDEQQKAEAQLIEELKIQVKSLEDKAASVESSEINSERRLVSRGSTLQECPVSLSSSTQDIIYISTVEQNVNMSLPYSFSWGSDAYFINPIDRSRGVAGEIYFGPGIASGDCLLVRDSLLMIDERRSSPNELRSELSGQDLKISNLRERTINGIPVLSYEFDRGADTERVWVGFGRTNHYTLQSAGWLTDTEAIKIIQSLRVTK